jgi:cysteine desulfurase family protein (TIGR01976 family)
VRARPDDCTLDADDFRQKLSAKTRLVALTCASNAVGTLTDVPALVRQAHAAGALVFLDAVHYAPHGPIDVRAWGCDFLACSAYKFFGPHVGILWGRRALLEALPAYKVRPAAETLPDRWMTGTQNHEGIAGVKAALDYLADLAPAGTTTYRQALVTGMEAIRAYEATLAQHLLEGLAARRRFRVYGITDAARLAERVPTVSVSAEGRDAAAVAAHLAAAGVYVWNGNMYALNLSERLGLEERGGFLRLGLVHYNTHDEIDRLLAALDGLR